MAFLASLWRKLTPTQALEDSSGKMETAFFESAYRVNYATGWSCSDRKTGYRLYSNTVKLMIALFAVGEGWYLASNYKSLDIFVEQLNVNGHTREHQHIYKKLAATMESSPFDTSTRARHALVEYWRLRSERYLKLILALETCTLAAWFVYPLIDDVECNLTVNVRLPLDYCSPVLYPVAYLTTLIAFNYAAYFIMTNDVILQAHLMQLLCQYAVLVDCFENILGDCEEHFKAAVLAMGKVGTKILYALCHSHTMELREILSLPMLAQITASGMQICFAGYQVATTITDSITKFLMSFLFLGYNMFQLFVFCRWCDEIKSQSAKIGDALYCSGWERGLTTIPGVRRRLLLVAMRANKPLVLTAGRLYDLSLSSFANLVKTSYTALTVLLRLRHD